MKPICIFLLSLFSFAAADDLTYDFLFVDSTVNRELHSLLYPIPENYAALSSVIISHAALDSLARNEMGKVIVFKISGQSSSGTYLTVGDEGVAFGDNLIKYQEVDYLEYKERKSFGGFLGAVAVVGLFSGAFFGTMEGVNWIARGDYDYKRVLVYGGALAGITAVFYFPTNTSTRIGFKFGK